MGWYADLEDVVCVVVQAPGGAEQQSEQLSSAPGGNAPPAAAADASCMAKSICGVGYSRLQRGDSLEQQEHLQQGGADAAAAAIAVAPAELQAQEEECSIVPHVEQDAAAEAVFETSQPAHARLSSALLLGDCSLLSPFWMAASSADDLAADADEEQPAAPDSTASPAAADGATANGLTATLAAATICNSTTAAAVAPVTVEELLAASEAVLIQLEAAFAGVRHTAGLLAEARVPLRERYGS
jgi:hypothetical protein